MRAPRRSSGPSPSSCSRATRWCSCGPSRRGWGWASPGTCGRGRRALTLGGAGGLQWPPPHVSYAGRLPSCGRPALAACADGVVAALHTWLTPPALAPSPQETCRGSGFVISYDQGRWSAPCFVTTTTGQAGVVLGVEKVRAVLCHAALRCIVLRFACFVGWLHAPSLGASVAHTHTLSLSSFSLPLYLVV